MTINIGNARKPITKYIEAFSAVSNAVDQIENWHAKKNGVCFRLNNFKDEYSDSHTNTTAAPHMAETNSSITVICAIRRERQFILKLKHWHICKNL